MRSDKILHTDKNSKRIVFFHFIYRLVSKEETKLRKLKIIDKRSQYTGPQTNHTRINY
jgi:hypothetical protein